MVVRLTGNEKAESNTERVSHGQHVGFRVPPGTVVGMLQHRGILRWDRMNGLKRKLEPTG